MNIEVKPDWWKTLFDDVYLKTDARSVCDGTITSREVDAICDLLCLAEDHIVLDLCGGQGRHSLELARRGHAFCTVLDYSEALLAHGRTLAEQEGCRVDFVQGDASATGLPGETFDHVLIMGNSLGYMPDTIDDLRIMKEALRLLKPGGNLIVDVTDGKVVREKFNPNAWHEIEDKIVVCRQRQLEENHIRAREIVLCKENGLMRDQSYAIRIYSSERLQALAKQSGFTAVVVHKGFSSHKKDGDYGFMNHRLLLTAQKPC